MKPFLPVYFAVFAFLTTGAAFANGGSIEETAFGVRLVALAPDRSKDYDTRILSGRTGLNRLKTALERLVSRSPFSAEKLKILKRSGEVSLVYLPGDVPKSQATGENVAVFLPNFIAAPEPGKTSFMVVVGRHGVKWTTDELAAVLAHELAGHGMQLQRGRIGRMRPIDLECEAYLYEERANQDLGLDKRTAEMVRFRKGLESHWCADFKRYMRIYRRDKMALWDELNPDVPELLALFEEYLRHARVPKS